MAVAGGSRDRFDIGRHRLSDHDVEGTGQALLAMFAGLGLTLTMRPFGVNIFRAFLIR